MFLRFSKLTVMIASFSLYSVSGFPWGDTGHRIVGKIAQNHLSSGASKQLAILMGSESLARSATWPDEVRSDPNKEYYGPYAPLHFVEIPDGMTYAESPKSPEGDIIQAMIHAEYVLRSENAPKAAKVEALRLLTHFVGDVHQPLHVGNGLDNGANLCTVKWFGRHTNLHVVWDSDMIQHTNLSYTEYVEFLDVPERNQGWSQGTFESWAAESQKVRPGVYPVVTQGGDPIPGFPYCKKDKADKIPDKVIPDLGYDYAYQFRPLYEQRLYLAGVRLAGLLNSIFQDAK